MNIDINTKFIMLIGTPLHQSFAARMQNAAYEAADINMRYFYNETDSEHLKEILEGLRYTPSFAGAAITRPNKVAVMRYLDEVDPLCKKMGACNTIVKNGRGKLVGYNTDGIGFLTSLERDGGFNVEGKTFFCIGAGGAGRSMCSVLAHAGAKKIYVADIIEQSARFLAADINDAFAPIAEHIPFGDYSHVAECDCVMNASGIGMAKSKGVNPMPPEYIVPGQFYFDACYNPDKTQFLLDAEAAGCPILNGLGMSLHQGAAQIKLWSGQEAPIEVMRNELQTIVAELNAQHRLADAPSGTRAAFKIMQERAGE